MLTMYTRKMAPVAATMPIRSLSVTLMIRVAKRNSITAKTPIVSDTACTTMPS